MDRDRVKKEIPLVWDISEDDEEYEKYFRLQFKTYEYPLDENDVFSIFPETYYITGVRRRNNRYRNDIVHIIENKNTTTEKHDKLPDYIFVCT